MSTSQHTVPKRPAALPRALVVAMSVRLVPLLVLVILSVAAGAAGHAMTDIPLAQWFVPCALMLVSAAGWLAGRRVLERCPGGREVRFTAAGRAGAVSLACNFLVIFPIIVLRDHPGGLVLVGGLLAVGAAALAYGMLDNVRRFVRWAEIDRDGLHDR
ncbi:hypothetical protein GCM10023169_14970 [Georgenia halophila]|uniref:DUF3180 family protein n=1 Tax=Georgenia halophila TaxID=620889 RepID=A0ABP8L4Z2_9MICO